LSATALKIRSLTKENSYLKKQISKLNLSLEKRARQERAQARRDAHQQDILKIKSQASSGFTATSYQKARGATERSLEEERRVVRLEEAAKKMRAEIERLSSENSQLRSGRIG